MKGRLHLLLCLGLLLAACDKPGASGSRAGESQDAPRITKSIRPPREEAPALPGDFRAALRLAGEIEAPAARDTAIAQVAWDALELDPDLAREAFDQLSPEGVERIRLLQHFAMRLAENDPDEALAWAATLGSEKEIAAARGQIALVLSESDPERAANLLSESGIAGREFDLAVVQVLQRWAAKSPPEAAGWVVLFPAGRSREAGIKTVVSQWVAARRARRFFLDGRA